MRLSLTWRAFIRVYFSVRQLVFRDHFGRFIFVLFFVFDADNTIYLYVGVHSLGAEKVIVFKTIWIHFIATALITHLAQRWSQGSSFFCQFPKCSVYSFLVFIICLFFECLSNHLSGGHCINCILLLVCYILLTMRNININYLHNCKNLTVTMSVIQHL